MDDYKKKYELLQLAASKAIETLQNALTDIENMGIKPEEELIPGYIEGGNQSFTETEEK